MVSTTESALRELAAAVRDVLKERVSGGPKRANLTSAIMTAFRPYVDEAVTGIAPKAVRDMDDRRVKEWRVSCEWWYGPSGKPDQKMGESEGRLTKPDGTVLKYGGDTFKGLDAVATHLTWCALQLGATQLDAGKSGEDWSIAAFEKALGYLRPTIQRNNGKATMRRTSSDGRWHLICDVFREGSFPKE